MSTLVNFLLLSFAISKAFLVILSISSLLYTRVSEASSSLYFLGPKYSPPVSSLTTIISSPSPIISSFNGLAFFNSLKRIAGLRFVKTSNSFLIFKSPFSGLNSASILSHLGPPTAPKRTASLFLQISIVSSDRGTPYLSIDSPPKYPLVKINL